MKRLITAATLLFALILGASSLRAETIVAGGTGSGNGFPFGNVPYPFGNPTNTYVGEYQQIYSSANFSGPLEITQIGFASQEAETYSLNLVLSLGYTLTTPNDASGNYASNIGPDFTTVFSGTELVNATGTDTFDLLFNLTTPFVYNPADGNLLLDVYINYDGASGLVSYVAGNNGDASRVFNLGGDLTSIPDTMSLETQFVGSPVPEPSSILLFGTGLLGIAAVARSSPVPRRRPTP